LANAHRSPVVIVGGGIAGLVSALELAIAGVEVTLLEKDSRVGGKLYSVNVNGANVDSGPTVFTMRWVFDALFEKAGTRLEEELIVHRAEILARHAWSKSERLDLFACHEQSAQAIRDFAGPAEADRFIRFCRQAQTTYRTLEAAYIRSERPTIASMHQDIGFSGLKVLWDLGMFQSLSRTPPIAARRHFRRPQHSCSLQKLRCKGSG
jgi:1-hydroxycarotenoid 3,4-desaturase